MDHVSSIFKTVLRKRGLYGEAMAGLALGTARKWIGTSLGAHARNLQPAKLERGCLIIHAHNPIALVECNQRTPELLRVLHERVPDFPITEVRVLRA